MRNLFFQLISHNRQLMWYFWNTERRGYRGIVIRVLFYSELYKKKKTQVLHTRQLPTHNASQEKKFLPLLSIQKKEKKKAKILMES